MLWAGADPYAKGPDSPDKEPDPDENISALEYAAIYGHLIYSNLNRSSWIPNTLLQRICLNTHAGPEKPTF
jgi:hypothetical protein